MLRCYVQSPALQDTFQPIPDLIICTGVTERWRFLLYPRKVAGCVWYVWIQPANWLVASQSYIAKCPFVQQSFSLSKIISGSAVIMPSIVKAVKALTMIMWQKMIWGKNTPGVKSRTLLAWATSAQSWTTTNSHNVLQREARHSEHLVSASVCMKVYQRCVKCPQWSGVLDKSSDSMNSCRHGLADG